MKPVVALARALPFFPRVYRVRHQEVEHPYRASAHALAVRVTGHRAVVFALMRHTGFTTPERALAALGARAHERIVFNRRETIDAHGPGGLLYDEDVE